MKTIVDIMAMCYDTIGRYCGGNMCQLCDNWQFCHVNVTLIAYEILWREGEYH